VVRKRPIKVEVIDDYEPAEEEDEDADDEPAAPADDPLRTKFRPKPYKADGGFNPLGLPILMLALCVAATALGWLASFIGQKFYLIFLFPLGIGAGVAVVGALVGHLTKMRNTIVAMVFGLVSGGVAVVAMHYFDYQRFLDERMLIGAAINLNQVEDTPLQGLTPEQAKVFQELKGVRDVNSLGSFMHFQATQGVSIGKIGQGGANLGFTGTWIYWVVELLAVAGMTAAGLCVMAAAPFCADCNKWKADKKLGTLATKGDDIVDVLKAGELNELHDFDPAADGGNVSLTAYVCPACKSDGTIVIKIEELVKKNKTEEEKKELDKLVYPGKALAAFKAVFRSVAKSKKKKPKDNDDDD
jgi:hypothetical protein